MPNIILMAVLFYYIYTSIIDGASIEAYFLIIPVATSFIGYLGSLLGFRESYLKNNKLKQRILSFVKIERDKQSIMNLTQR